MKKRQFAWICILALSACFQHPPLDIGDSFKEDPVRLEQALSCHNTYLGLSYTFPVGWWLYDLNTANLSPEPADTEDTAQLDIIYDEDNRFMELAYFANQSSWGRRNFCGFSLNAELREGTAGIAEYMKDFEGHLREKYGQDIVFLNSETVGIVGVSFEKRIFEVSRSQDSFGILTLSTAVQNGYFLNIIAYYRADNKNADSFIFDALEKALALE